MSAPQRLIFAHWNGKVSARDDRYMLDDVGHLYDLAADPGQSTDVRSKVPDEANRLTNAVDEWKSTVLAELSTEPRPFTVGYRQFPSTVLPARDGVPHGNIQRSARAPNCSFFTNWTSVDDRVTWDIDVATTGRYQATAYYTCAAADVGSTIELRCGGHNVTARVTEAHDPPLVGAEHDRVPREGESFVKDFKPLPLGTIELSKGRSELALFRLGGARTHGDGSAWHHVKTSR